VNRNITVTPIEPAPLSLRWPLGVDLDLRVTMRTLQGVPVNPTNAQLALLPRTRGGVLPFDMVAYDVANGVARIEIPGSSLTDRNGFGIELFARQPSEVPGDPPKPVALVAKGVLVTEGAGYASTGPLSMINVPVVVGPPGPAGPQGIGVQGDPGEDGQRGSMWFTGLGDPTMTGSFIVGDMYLDSASGNVWRWEGTGAWVLQ
jgi:hypothetical protein